jgi:hypothetical protein
LADFVTNSVLVRSNAIAQQFDITASDKKSTSSSTDLKPPLLMSLFDDGSLSDNLNDAPSENKQNDTPAYLESFGGFREKLIEAFVFI